jgi:hypothetical protein
MNILSGDLMATILAARRHDLTEAQWTVLEPLLPTGRPQSPVVTNSEWTSTEDN